MRTNHKLAIATVAGVSIGVEVGNETRPQCESKTLGLLGEEKASAWGI
jgi:hypothetical protein